MIQLSQFLTHPRSFWNGSVFLELAESASGRVALLQLLSVHDEAVGVTDLGVMFLWLLRPRESFYADRRISQPCNPAP